jgi:hypothetical protein
LGFDRLKKLLTTDDVISKDPEITPDIHRLPQMMKNIFVPPTWRNKRYHRHRISLSPNFIRLKKSACEAESYAMFFLRFKRQGH